MERLTDREKEILELLRNTPMISQEELAEIVGVSRSAAAVHISNLIKKGHILGRGYVFNDKSPVFVVGPVFMEIDAFSNSGGQEQVDIAIGGKGHRIARNLSSLGVPVSFVSVIGRDELGGAVSADLREHGVNTTYLITQIDFPTPRRVILRDSQGIKKVVTDLRALDRVKSESLHYMGAALKESRAVLLDASMPGEIFTYFTGLARESEIPVCVFATEEIFPEIFPQTTGQMFLAVVSRKQAEKTTGLKIRDLDDGLVAGEIIVKSGFESVVVVIPGQGVCCTGREEKITVPLPPGQNNLFDLSIGGLIANVTANILQGYDLRQNLRLAMVNVIDKSRTAI